MPFALAFSDRAKGELARLERTADKKLKKVRKTLAYLETNPKHQGLNVHRYHSLRGPGGEDVWVAYVENKTPSAFRVFFFIWPRTRQDHGVRNYPAPVMASFIVTGKLAK